MEYVFSVMLKWFKSNYLQANPEKFSIYFLRQFFDIFVLSAGDNGKLKSEASVKLLGVTTDSQHINDLCHEADRQINALNKLSKILNHEVK